MKSMSNLELEGQYIRINPGDSIKKWARIDHATREGLLATVTCVRQGSWSSNDGWIKETQRFLSWEKLSFYICDKEEAMTGERAT
tara:strand:- start:523 stop:777 length:255 start_codon:yes stop_codon:yes gene_type:complete